jgi:hypothetical protein
LSTVSTGLKIFVHVDEASQLSREKYNSQHIYIYYGTLSNGELLKLSTVALNDHLPFNEFYMKTHFLRKSKCHHKITTHTVNFTILFIFCRNQQKYVLSGVHNGRSNTADLTIIT